MSKLSCGVCKGSASSAPARKFFAPTGSRRDCPVHGFRAEVTADSFEQCVETLHAQGVVGEIKRDRLLDDSEPDVGEVQRIWRTATTPKKEAVPV